MLATVGDSQFGIGRVDEESDLFFGIGYRLHLVGGPLHPEHRAPHTAFEPDPLGKSYPDQPVPVYVPGELPLAAYSLEQIAYLLPVEESISMCAADQVKTIADDPVAHFFVFRPIGTFKDDFADLIAPCG